MTVYLFFRALLVLPKVHRDWETMVFFYCFSSNVFIRVKNKAYVMQLNFSLILK